MINLTKADEVGGPRWAPGVGLLKRVTDVSSPEHSERNKHGDRLEWTGVYANYIRLFKCFCG